MVRGRNCLFDIYSIDRILHWSCRIHAKKEGSSEVRRPVSRLGVFLLFGIIQIPLGHALAEGIGLPDAIKLRPLLLIAGLSLLFAISRNTKGLAEKLADSSLVAFIIGIFVSIISLYSNFGKLPRYHFIEPHVFFQVTNNAHDLFLYGSWLYIFSFFLSLRLIGFAEVDFKKRNWHMLEALGFYVFMTLAAPSIFELV